MPETVESDPSYCVWGIPNFTRSKSLRGSTRSISVFTSPKIVLNPLTAVLAAPSLEKRPIEVPDFKSLRLFLLFSHEHVKGFLPKCTVLKVELLQPGNFTSWGSEGVKDNFLNVRERSFGYIAPTVWNSLPADLRASPSLPTFKVNLKTHFFRQAF